MNRCASEWLLKLFWFLLFLLNFYQREWKCEREKRIKGKERKTTQRDKISEWTSASAVAALSEATINNEVTVGRTASSSNALTVSPFGDAVELSITTATFFISFSEKPAKGGRKWVNISDATSALLSSITLCHTLSFSPHFPSFPFACHCQALRKNRWHIPRAPIKTFSFGAAVLLSPYSSTHTNTALLCAISSNKCFFCLKICGLPLTGVEWRWRWRWRWRRCTTTVTAAVAVVAASSTKW
mgnify:CR=1 FL=1